MDVILVAVVLTLGTASITPEEAAEEDTEVDSRPRGYN